ncbi:MAG: DRTGG domain-containing protein [Anaerolineales bacterium]
MTIQEIVEKLGFKVLAGQESLDREVTGGYVADLLSCVMAGAREGQLWFTLQTHLNIVAVASLLGVAGVVVTEGAAVPAETVQKAQEEGVVLLSSELPTFETVRALIPLGF